MKKLDYQTFAEYTQNGQSFLIFLENKIKSGGPWCKFLDITKMYEIQAEIGAIIFEISTINSPYLSRYGHRIHKSWFNR